MKQLLTTLLILICFSCGDEHDKNYPRNDTTQKEREHDETLDVVSDWAYDKCTEYFDKSIFLSNASGNRDSINKYNYLGEAMREVHTKVLSLKYRNKKHESLPKPSPLPDTAKPLKIKMQPRWRDSCSCDFYEAAFRCGWNILDDSHSLAYGVSDKYEITNSGNSTTNDTTRCLLLVSDTSSQNGFRSSRCFWMYGYEIDLHFNEYGDTICLDKNGNEIPCSRDRYFQYLDESKRPLPKNYVVWLSKELK